jgi:mitotic spindle assembly checkpoint protein MAD2
LRRELRSDEVRSSELTSGSVKKYGLSMMLCLDDQVKAYIKKIMGQLSKWMQKSKISTLVIVITSKDTGEHVERWQIGVSAKQQA